MKGYVEKLVHGKLALCKTVTVRDRAGKPHKREFCYEKKPDGTKGRLVSSKIAGNPKYTLDDLRRIEASRPTKSRARDEATTSEVVISPKDPRVNSWAENENVRRRIDVRGVDTAGGSYRKYRTPTRKTSRRPSNKGRYVCRKLPNGREICRDTVTGRIVSPKIAHRYM